MIVPVPCFIQLIKSQFSQNLGMAARNAVASPPFQFEPHSGLEKYQECQQSLPLDIQGLERTATLGVAHVKIGDMTEM
jgi:hypothetical protein